MAMSASTLGTAIANAVDGLSAAQKENLETVWQTIATEIVNHITTNAIVSGTCTGATGSGPAGGPLPITAQPTTGTIS